VLVVHGPRRGAGGKEGGREGGDGGGYSGLVEGAWGDEGDVHLQGRKGGSVRADTKQQAKAGRFHILPPSLPPSLSPVLALTFVCVYAHRAPALQPVWLK
jgi:hypothetical protein